MLDMPLLETRELSKSFPGVVALDRVDIEGAAGEVLAVVGANGAGKSTLMNLLAGVFPPSGGEIRLDGRPVVFTSPRAAREAGIATVYQDVSSIPELSVAENIFLGREPAGSLGSIDRPRLHAQTVALLARHQLPLDPMTPVEHLGVADRQLVELARALSVEARVLVLDEPTSVLSMREQENLFGIIGKLKQAGLLVLYVSHRLDEVFAVADRVTVLRDGRKMGTLAAANATQDDLVRMMTGQNASREFPVASLEASAAPVLEAVVPAPGGEVHLSMRGGEIVGLAGMVGSGRTRLARRFVGLDGGGAQVKVGGRPLRIRSPRQALHRGIVYLTEDRKRDGVFANLPVTSNTTAASLGRISRLGFLSRREEHTRSQAILERLRLTSRSLTVPARELSGGNQQKLLIARALLSEPRVLICDEPTRGVDVGAKDEIYAILLELATQGVAILMISSEIKELLAVTHRLLVMRDGRVVAEMSTSETDEQAVVAAATGGGPAAAVRLDPIPADRYK
jgi:ABC-type sugar transport system ATPase subunit